MEEKLEYELPVGIEDMTEEEKRERLRLLLGAVSAIPPKQEIINTLSAYFTNGNSKFGLDRYKISAIVNKAFNDNQEERDIVKAILSSIVEVATGNENTLEVAAVGYLRRLIQSAFINDDEDEDDLSEA